VSVCGYGCVVVFYTGQDLLKLYEILQKDVLLLHIGNRRSCYSHCIGNKIRNEGKVKTGILRSGGLRR